MCYTPVNIDMLSTEDFKLNLEKPSAAKKTVRIKRVSVKRVSFAFLSFFQFFKLAFKVAAQCLEKQQQVK